jgi:hypothetical protein
MDVLPVLIAHNLIHNGKLNPLRKDVAIGLSRIPVIRDLGAAHLFFN